MGAWRQIPEAGAQRPFYCCTIIDADSSSTVQRLNELHHHLLLCLLLLKKPAQAPASCMAQADWIFRRSPVHIELGQGVVG